MARHFLPSPYGPIVRATSQALVYSLGANSRIWRVRSQLDGREFLDKAYAVLKDKVAAAHLRLETFRLKDATGDSSQLNY